MQAQMQAQMQMMVEQTILRLEKLQQETDALKKAFDYYGVNGCMAAYAQRYISFAYDHECASKHVCKRGTKKQLVELLHLSPRSPTERYSGLREKYIATRDGQAYPCEFDSENPRNYLICCGLLAYLLDHGLVCVWAIPFRNGVLKLVFESNERISKLGLRCVDGDNLQIGGKTYSINMLRYEFHDRYIGWSHKKARPYYRCLMFRILSSVPRDERSDYEKSDIFTTYRDISLTRSMKSEHSPSCQVPPSDKISISTIDNNNNYHYYKKTQVKRLIWEHGIVYLVTMIVQNSNQKVTSLIWLTHVKLNQILQETIYIQM